MRLIDKDALVAEIKKRGNICKKVVLDLRTEENKDYYQGKAEAYKETLDLLDTLEVKEVQEEPVSKTLEEAAFDYADACKYDGGEKLLCVEHFKAGAKWKQINADTLEMKEVHDIWHDVSEKPELEQPLLIIMKGTHKDFRRHYRIGCYGKRANDIPTWVINGCYSDSFISKWCYISDILQHTLEVKEVDLEKEFDNYAKNILACDVQFEPFTHLYNCAKYFYELGLKTKDE